MSRSYNILRSVVWSTFSLLWINISSAQTFNNPISRPQPGEILIAGSTYNIIWTPNTGDTIGLEIWNSFSIASAFPGSNCVLDDNNTMCAQLSPGMPNSGSFSWKIPNNAPPSDNYFLDIYVPNPGLGGPFYYMTGNFSIRNEAASTPTSTIAQLSTIAASVGASSGSNISARPSRTPLFIRFLICRGYFKPFSRRYIKQY